jgi:predicted alpha/beta-hydrolase family hydrolase
VACRTAAETGSVAVVCLAFPLHPPGRPEKSRLAELDAVTVPTLVVQGEKDPFGIPPARPNRTVTLVPGTHSLRSSAAVADAVLEWLARRLYD